MDYVIYSREESKLEGKGMFWNNIEGWTELDTADVFTSMDINLPVGDACLVEKEYADKLVTRITCDEAIENISEILSEASGEFIAEIVRRVCGLDVEYEGDSELVIYGNE